MGKLTIPLLILSIIGFVFTVRLVHALNNSKRDGLKETLQSLRATYPASGAYHGVNIEVGFLIFAAIVEGIAIGDTIRVVLIMTGWEFCRRPGDIPEEEAENFKWRKPDLLYTTQVERLIVLGSIWNKCSFYGLFCWGSGPVLKWQDVLPHVLEMVFFWRGSGVITPSGLSRSGAPNTCAFQDESEMIRGTLLLSFITYFVLVPLSYVGCLWNYDIALSCCDTFTWALLSAWGFIWAFIVNAFSNIKFILSLASLLSLQAYYLGSGHGTAQLVIAIVSCLFAAQTAHSLWVVMQFMLRQSMFKSQLIEKGPPPLESPFVHLAGFALVGGLSIALYCICAKPLQGSLLFQLDLAFGILWLCLSVLARISSYLLAVPAACTIGVLQGCALQAAQNKEVQGGKGDIEMQVLTTPPAPLETEATDRPIVAGSVPVVAVQAGKHTETNSDVPN